MLNLVKERAAQRRYSSSSSGGGGATLEAAVVGPIVHLVVCNCDKKKQNALPSIRVCAINKI